MPVVAVGLAIALDVGAIGALAAGTLTTLAAVTAIGATVSAVGAVTHNKTLSMIGMGIGIVGAVGTLASGAGLFDNVTDLFGPSSMSAADTASLASDAASMSGAAAEALPGSIAAAAGASTAADLTTAMGAINTGAFNPVVANSAALAPAEGNAAAIAGGAPGTALSGAISPAAADAVSGATGSALTSPMGTPDFASMFKMPAIANSDVSGGLMAWAKDNPMLAFGALQAGGSFISGLTNPVNPAQIDALNAQSDVNRATAELLRRQTANQGAALPTATISQVTGAPAQSGGLINNSVKPAGSALITGVPNTGTPPKQYATGTV